MRDRIREILARTASPASLFNHAMLHTRQDWTGRFRDIAVPVLILHGQDDPILPVENGEALAAGIASSELIVHEGVGHEPPSSEVETIATIIVARLLHERHLRDDSVAAEKPFRDHIDERQKESFAPLPIDDLTSADFASESTLRVG